MPSVGSGTYSPGPNMGCSPQKKVRTGSVEAITCPGYSNLRIPATVSIFHLANDDRRAVFCVVALDRRCIGRTAVNRDLLRHAVPPDRLLQKAPRRRLV